MSRATTLEVDPAVEARLASLKGSRDLGTNGGDTKESVLPRCKFEIGIPDRTWEKIANSDEEVYRFLQDEGADLLMKAYLNISGVNPPRGGEFFGECHVTDKEKGCSGGISIRF
jgi:hypothetical protein